MKRDNYYMTAFYDGAFYRYSETGQYLVKDDFEPITTDDDLNHLSQVQSRINNIKSRIIDELDAIDVLSKTSEQLKKIIAEKYEGSVSNGSTLIKIINKTPPIDYRQAFEFLGGEEAVLEKDEQLDSFRRTTGSRQISIQHGDIQWVTLKCKPEMVGCIN